MNQEERSRLAATWAQMAEIYGRKVTIESLKIMVDSIEEQDFQKVMAFMKKWPSIEKVGRHPYPAEIVTAITPQKPDNRMIALEVARKIDKAIQVHGWTWEGGFYSASGPRYWEAYTASGVQQCFSFKDAVITELGEVAWHAISSRGGWLSLRDSQKDMEEGQFIAQLRDQVQASYTLAEQGHDVTLIEMPKPPQEVHVQIEERNYGTGNMVTEIIKRMPKEV